MLDELSKIMQATKDYIKNLLSPVTRHHEHPHRLNIFEAGKTAKALYNAQIDYYGQVTINLKLDIYFNQDSTIKSSHAEITDVNGCDNIYPSHVKDQQTHIISVKFGPGLDIMLCENFQCMQIEHSYYCGFVKFIGADQTTPIDHS